MRKHLIAMGVIALGCTVVSTATGSPQVATTLFETVMALYVINVFE